MSLYPIALCQLAVILMHLPGKHFETYSLHQIIKTNVLLIPIHFTVAFYISLVLTGFYDIHISLKLPT
jgi:hypothetical protein